MAAETPITDPYSSPHAAELDGETVESFMKKHMSSVPAREAIDVACKAAFGRYHNSVPISKFVNKYSFITFVNK